jgi:hypothetical protein
MKPQQVQETTGGSSARNESVNRDLNIERTEMNPLALGGVSFVIGKNNVLYVYLLGDNVCGKLIDAIQCSSARCSLDWCETNETDRAREKKIEKGKREKKTFSLQFFLLLSSERRKGTVK